jgi:hypothetical protein
MASQSKSRRNVSDAFYVCEGYWHPRVKSGQVHAHPEQPGRGWSSASHRQCEPVYTRHDPATSTAEPEWGIIIEDFKRWAQRGKKLLDDLEDMYA